MRVNEVGSATIVSALRHAAARTGTDFGFLMAQARAESGLRVDAQAATSSARGLFQFTNATWLDVVERHGGNHPALGWAADALKSGAAAAGTAMRDAVLALRDSPEAASLMAGELARDNRGRLEARLGRAVGAAEVHMAHFLGQGGATNFLRALDAAPQAPAASVVPQAAAANRAIFYTPGGAARSLEAVMRIMAGKIGAAPSMQAAGLPAGGLSAGETQAARALMAQAPRSAVSAASAVSAVSAAPERGVQARAAYLLLAELGG